LHECIAGSVEMQAAAAELQIDELWRVRWEMAQDAVDAQREFRLKHLWSTTFDVDKNGCLDRQEFRTAARTALGCELGSGELERIMREVDTNKDGVISFEEFLLAIGGFSPKRRAVLLNRERGRSMVSADKRQQTEYNFIWETAQPGMEALHVTRGVGKVTSVADRCVTMAFPGGETLSFKPQTQWKLSPMYGAQQQEQPQQEQPQQEQPQQQAESTDAARERRTPRPSPPSELRPPNPVCG